MFDTDEIYPVSSFVNLCSKLVKNQIPPVWISGEVSNLSTPSSGHMYFSLKDDNSQISCAFFKFSNQRLAFKIADGMQLMVYGGVNIYEPRGSFQLIIQKAQGVGIGNLELGFEQLKKKLQSQGLFDEKHKKPLVKSPQKIGVITSKTGAVLQDIINITSKRYPFAELKIYDTPTQGENASTLIISALHAADLDNNDTLIIARGGGSREDLWCFNNEDLALAVFDANTPIISSIGHEVDSTIIDFVADIYAPTPSAAAMLATPDRLEILQNLEYMTKSLHKIIITRLNNTKDKLTAIEQRLLHPNFDKQYQRVDELEMRIINYFKHYITLNYSQVNRLKSEVLMHNPQQVLEQKHRVNNQLRSRLLEFTTHLNTYNIQVIEYEKSLQSLMKHKIFLEKNNLTTLISALNHLSPLQVLDRGYSITSKGKNAISSVKCLSKGDVIVSKFSDGEIASKVE